MKTARELQWEAYRLRNELQAQHPDLEIKDIRIRISNRMISSAGQSYSHKREIVLSFPFTLASKISQMIFLILLRTKLPIF